jgi:hypothetical protein
MKLEQYRQTMTSDVLHSWAVDAQAEIERLRAEVVEWEKLRNPVTLHANLLRGIPCRLDRATFLHLAGDETPNDSITGLGRKE